MISEASLQALKDAKNKAQEDKKAISLVIADLNRQSDAIDIKKTDLKNQINNINAIIADLNTDISGGLPA